MAEQCEFLLNIVGQRFSLPEVRKHKKKQIKKVFK